MKYKALFLDLDGTTILNGSKNPPNQKVIQAIKKAHSKIHVSIATGRGLWEIDHIVDSLCLTGPCIILNGVQIYDPVQKRIIKEISLDQTLIPKIKNILEKYQGTIYIFDGTAESIIDKQVKQDKVLSYFITGLSELSADNLIDEISHISQIATHKLIPWRYEYYSVEITDVKASKLHGIVEIAKMLGISTHEMIGVGDSYNDFPLLMACGLKIAMGNAVPELKAIADFVAPSVDEDGVATIIEKFILSE